MASNVGEYTVSELSFALKRTVENAFGLVRLRGEISGLKRAASGHVYLALKDDKAVIDGVMWRGSAGRLAFKPEDGLEIVCTGKLTTYPGRSKYQIVIEHMEPAGAGALMALFEERKRKLEAEGLFAAERKRSLPFLPGTIGIVTSPTGAVIRDILHRLTERFPCHVLLQPVLVQGEDAAVQIAEAIERFQKVEPKPDVLIVARGGGSIEDLWAFNEEAVVRAAAASTIPLISAVGHETDTTLIDYVSDKRAPTPTAAAEMAVPVRSELLSAVANLSERQIHGMQRQLRQLQQQIDGLARGLPDPRLLLTMTNQRFDDLCERLRLRSPGELIKDRADSLDQRHKRLGELLRDRLASAAERAAQLGSRLSPEPIVKRIDDAGPVLERLQSRLQNGAIQTIDRSTRRLQSADKLLESMSHKRVLERGYALVHRPDQGGLVQSRQLAEKEAVLELEFHDGRMHVARSPAARKPRKAARVPTQETLL